MLKRLWNFLRRSEPASGAPVRVQPGVSAPVSKTKMVWNTVGCEMPSHIPLDQVISIYEALGHAPRSSGCACCYYCKNCDRELLDDLRTESSLTKRCANVKLTDAGGLGRPN